MNASDYPITFPYKATDPPYGTPELPYHRGVDRAMPQGTPVVVNGVTIGLSGNTGLSTGAHLHIGRFVRGKDTDPGTGGFTFNEATVTEINEDATNGKYVRVQADGASWVYLHLSDNTKVKVGQVLRGGDMPSYDGEVEFNNKYFAFMGSHQPPTDGDRKRWVFNGIPEGQPGSNADTAEANTVTRAMQADPRHANYLQYVEGMEKALANGNTGSGNFKKVITAGTDLYTEG